MPSKVLMIRFPFQIFEKIMQANSYVFIVGKGRKSNNEGF